jgi:DNA-binding GntR family transcriptional regulator
VDIDRASSVPPYQQIADQLRAAIIRGDFPPRSRLPGVEHIVQDSGVARMTARKALRILREQGWAYDSIGMGTYVAPRDQWPADE